MVQQSTPKRDAELGSKNGQQRIINNSEITKPNVDDCRFQKGHSQFCQKVIKITQKWNKNADDCWKLSPSLSTHKKPTKIEKTTQFILLEIRMRKCLWGWCIHKHYSNFMIIKKRMSASASTVIKNDTKIRNEKKKLLTKSLHMQNLKLSNIRLKYIIIIRWDIVKKYSQPLQKVIQKERLFCGFHFAFSEVRATRATPRRRRHPGDQRKLKY